MKEGGKLCCQQIFQIIILIQVFSPVNNNTLHYVMQFRVTNLVEWITKVFKLI